ncbi:MAG: TVP38/TMEM64 family protein [Pseudomonadota bacterium]
MTSKTKILALLGALVLLGIAAWQFPIAEWLTDLVKWIEANRQTAWLVFIAVYVLATVLMLPGLILTLAAGYVFGVLYGTVLVSVSSVLGATAAFLVGRSLGRGWVREKVGADARLAAIDKATEKRGFLVMLLLRLSPIFPFNVMNYLMSLTGMSLKNYVAGSWLGMLPGTLLYVFIGSAASDLTALIAGEYDAGPYGQFFFIGGLIATLVVTVLIARFAAKTLNETIGVSEDDAATQE